MITFVKELLKTTRFLIAMGLVTAALWLLVAAVLFSTVSAYRVKARYAKARRHYQQGSMAEAGAQLRAVRRLNRSLEGAYTLAGKIAFDAKDYESATGHFENAMKLGDKSADIRAALAVTRIMRYYFPGAALYVSGKSKLLDAASDPACSGGVFVNLGSIFLYENNPAEALAYYRKALASRNVSKEGLVHLYNGLGVIQARKAGKAAGFQRRQLLEDAKVEFRKAALIDPNRPDVTINQLMVDLASTADQPVGDRGRSAAMKRAEDFYKNHKQETGAAFRYALLHNRGLKAYANGEYEKACRAFEGALAANPLSKADSFNRLVAYLAAVRETLSREMISTARAIIEKLAGARSAPADEAFSLLAELAAIEYADGDLNAARKHFEQAEKLIGDAIHQTDAARVYRALAILSYDEERYRDTLEMIGRAVQADPTMTDLERIAKRLKRPPRVTFPVVLNKEYLPATMPAVRAEVYSRSTPEPLTKQNMTVTIGKTQALIGFTRNSQIVALPARPLGEGVHEVLVRATDSLGNTNQAKTRIVIDNSPPSVSVNPAGGSTLKPGVHTFTVSLKDQVAGVDYSSIKLFVSRQPIEGDMQNFLLVEKGKFTEMGGLDMDGVPVQEDEFSFRLEGRLTPGKCSFTLQAADVRGNKMKEFRWSYTIAEEGEQ